MAEDLAPPQDIDFDRIFAIAAGDELPDNAPADDRTDTALKERTKSYGDADNLNWLMSSDQAPEQEPSALGMVGAAAADIGRGAVETPRQIVGGIRDAGQSLLDFTDWAGQFAEKHLPIGGVQLFDKEGNFDVDILSSEELRAAREGGMTGLELPDVGDPKSNTGAAVRGISQFLAGFGVAGKALGTVGTATKAGQIGRVMGQGAAADFFAFGPQEQRLSNLIESVPALENPITEYLAADENDGEIEGRLKNAVEGLGLGLVTDGLFKGLRAYKKMRAISRDKNAAQNIADAVKFVDEEQTLRGAVDLDQLGSASPDAPLVKMRSAVQETETGVPGDVAAKSLKKEAPIVRFRREASVIEKALPPVPDGQTRLWRGNRPGEVGKNTSFTNDLAGIALPFKEGYGGSLSYIDVPTEDLAKYVKTSGAATDAEFSVSQAVAANAKEIVAPETGYSGLTPIDEAGDVYVNFARINTPEDIQKIIKDTSSAFSTEINAARRGVRTNAQTALAADKIDAWDTLMSRRSGAPLNAEESFAARQLWATSADKLGEIANFAAQNPTPENLFQFRKMLSVHHAIQKEVIAARSETARALQSWAMPAGGSTEKMRSITDALNRGGGVETSADLARRLAILSKMDGAAGAMSNFIEKSVYAKTLGSVQEYWINSLLSGPKTHLVNMMSNTGVMGLDIAERGVAARLGRVFLDETGVEVGEAAAQIAGTRGAVLDAFRYAGKAFRTGQTGFGMDKVEMPRQRYISSGSWNVRSESWLGRGIDGLGTVVNIPGKLLQAEDEFFKTLGYRREMHALAHRTATQELRSGKLPKEAFKQRIAEILDNPPEAVRLDATAHAAYQTFTNEPGKFTRGVQRLTGEYPALKFIIPFINTPANILKYTFERTPLAPITSKYRAAMAKGGADADLAMTKMAMGTMAMMYAVDLGMNGQTTGSGPTDFAEKDNWRRQGYQPYSVKIGDRWIAFNRLDPMGYHLGIGADIAEFLANADASEETAAEIQDGVAASIFAVGENITSKAYLQGVSMLMEALNEPDRFAPAYLERFASSFVPSGVGEVARFIDPVMRASHDIVSASKRKLPVFTEDLPARRDLWGREIKYQSGFGSLYDAMSPLYGSTYNPEPIDKLMQEDGWFVGMGGYGFTIEGEYVSLKNRPDIKSRFYELRGGTKPSEMGAYNLIDKYGDSTLLETLNGLVTGEAYQADQFQSLENPDDREDFAKRIVRDYYTAAKDVLFGEYPELMQIAERKKAARQ